MFKVGVKIDFWHFYVQSRSQNRSVTILNLYMGGEGNSPFPPLHPCFDRRLDRCLDRCLDPRLDRRLDRCGSLCPSMEFFVFFRFFGCYFKRAFLLEIAFPSCIFSYGLVCVENLASQQQKSENQKILHTFAPLETKKLANISSTFLVFFCEIFANF